MGVGDGAGDCRGKRRAGKLGGQRGLRGGALGEIRTHDLCLRRAALYPLSYKRAGSGFYGAEGGI